jgi:redox-sensitive bicupin YhaK (pirin superfamily)
MIQVRKSEERGHVDHGWLNTYHSFSFSGYHDPRFVHFHTLRVLNEDWVIGGEGFDTHPHDNMEIVTYVIEGALEHKDSMGTGSVIRAGDVQRMSAGTGVTHSEFNHSKTETVHLLQIWVFPEKKGLKPEYEQKSFSPESKKNQLRLVVSPDGKDGSVQAHQDARFYASLLDAKKELTHEFSPGRSGYLHLVSGKISLNGKEIGAGDGAMISEEKKLQIQGMQNAEFILIDLA